MFISSVKEAVF